MADEKKDQGTGKHIKQGAVDTGKGGTGKRGK